MRETLKNQWFSASGRPEVLQGLHFPRNRSDAGVANQKTNKTRSQFGTSLPSLDQAFPVVHRAPSAPAMGSCPSRQPRQPCQVYNLQNVAAASPGPLPPAPPPPKRSRKRSARDHRQRALEDLFTRGFQTFPTTNKVHIQGYCPSTRKDTAKMMHFCKHCQQAYLRADAASQPETTSEDDED